MIYVYIYRNSHLYGFEVRRILIHEEIQDMWKGFKGQRKTRDLQPSFPTLPLSFLMS